jgi:hypothetical protein
LTKSHHAAAVDHNTMVSGLQAMEVARGDFDLPVRHAIESSDRVKRSKRLPVRSSVDVRTVEG